MGDSDEEPDPDQAGNLAGKVNQVGTLIDGQLKTSSIPTSPAIEARI